VDEKSVRRAGLDYWHLLSVVEHESFTSFQAGLHDDARLFFFTGKAKRSFLDVVYQTGDYLVFGKESTGLSEAIIAQAQDQLVAIPTLGPVRSLNLANCAALGVYEALRQIGALNATQLVPLSSEGEE
jgi:tRNA (cytidine/uridine-2'-O-)-methyltransferase